MTDKLSRSGERGEITDEEDLEWEYAVATAGPAAITSWHRVVFDEQRPLKCWGDSYYESGMVHGCFEIATTEIGLCAEHYEEMIP